MRTAVRYIAIPLIALPHPPHSEAESKEKHGVCDPMPELTINLTLYHSRPESTSTHLPWATLCQSQPYPPPPHARVEFIPQSRSLDLVCLFLSNLSLILYTIRGRYWSARFLAVVWCGLYLPSVSLFFSLSLHVCVACQAYLRDGGEGGQITGRRESLVLYSTLNTLCACPYPSAARLR